MQNTMIITGEGRVVRDLTPQKNETTQKQFLTFVLAVNTGYGDKKSVYYIKCSVNGDLAVERMVKAGVKKGSHLFVSGEVAGIELTEKDGTQYTNIKVRLSTWNYVPSSLEKPKDSGAPQENKPDINGAGEYTAQDFAETTAINEDDLPF